MGDLQFVQGKLEPLNEVPWPPDADGWSEALNALGYQGTPFFHLGAWSDVSCLVEVHTAKPDIAPAAFASSYPFLATVELGSGGQCIFLPDWAALLTLLQQMAPLAQAVIETNRYGREQAAFMGRATQ